MRINKFIKIKSVAILVFMLCAFVIISCSNKNDSTQNTTAKNARNATADKISVVATIFPEYDWVREIAGDTEKIEITLLMQSGVDMHSFQPSVDDMIKIANCNLFIYAGGESDAWVEDALKNARNKNMVVVNLLETLGDMAKKEEVVEGMQEDEHDHDEHAHHDDEGEHESEEHDEDEHHHEDEEALDEHVWLSLRNAEFFVNVLAEQLGKLDTENAATYKSNAYNYIAKLSALDDEYKAAVQNAERDTLLFCDRFPFRYLVDDYGLRYYAAFVGCSAETEASFETVAFLSKKTDELLLSNVITIEGTTHKIAETVIANTSGKNQNVLVLDSMQSVNLRDIANGASYIGIMQKNLDVLKRALN